MSAPWSCYFLRTAEDPIQTYIGATTDIHRRLRQHNGELSGGARRTTAISTHRGPHAWLRVCHVRGFIDNHQCLRFEWWWKARSRKLNLPPIERRTQALQDLLGLDEWQHLEVVWEQSSDL